MPNWQAKCLFYGDLLMMRKAIPPDSAADNKGLDLPSISLTDIPASAHIPVIDRQKRLLEGARQLLHARAAAADLFPKGILRDAAWDMLLELFISGEEGGTLYVKQLIGTSGESVTGTMRRIERLEDARFLTRRSDPFDKRRVIVRLTERGRTALIGMLQPIFDPHPAPAPPVV